MITTWFILLFLKAGPVWKIYAQVLNKAKYLFFSNLINSSEMNNVQCNLLSFHYEQSFFSSVLLVKKITYGILLKWWAEWIISNGFLVLPLLLLGYQFCCVAPTLESNNICNWAQLVQGYGALLQEDLYHSFKNSHSAWKKTNNYTVEIN